ncbi:Regulation of nuclear pre-mRNA domain-containing protein 1A [Geranomyces michiganensis]|nr:Regulation of nuclear pre-mRNA domain-containing protein 1A [Geranomyces michiganensis]
MYHRKHAASSVQTWAKELRKAAPSRKLAYLYLANDVVQSSRRKGDEFVREFAKVFPETLPHVFKTSVPETQLKIGRILGILEQRRIYTPEFVQSIKDNLGGQRHLSSPQSHLTSQPKSQFKPSTRSNTKYGESGSVKTPVRNNNTPSEGSGDSPTESALSPTYLLPEEPTRPSPPTEPYRPLPTRSAAAAAAAAASRDSEYPPGYMSEFELSRPDQDDSKAPAPSPSSSFSAAAGAASDQKKSAAPARATAKGKKATAQAKQTAQVVSDNKVTGDVASIAQHLEAIKQLDIAKATQSLVMNTVEAEDDRSNQPIIASLTRYRLTLAEDIAKRTSLIRELQTLQERMLVFVKGDQIALQKCNERIAFLHARRKTQTVPPLRSTALAPRREVPSQVVYMDHDQQQPILSPQPALSTTPSSSSMNMSNPMTVAAPLAPPPPLAANTLPTTTTIPNTANTARREYIPYSVGQIVAPEVAKILSLENSGEKANAGGGGGAGGGRAQLASSIVDAIARAKDGNSPVLPMSGLTPSPVTPFGQGAAAAPVVQPAITTAGTTTTGKAAGGTATATGKAALAHKLSTAAGRPSASAATTTPGGSKTTTGGGPIRTKLSGPNPAFKPLGRPSSAQPSGGGGATTTTAPSSAALPAALGTGNKPPPTMQSIAIPADGIMTKQQQQQSGMATTLKTAATTAKPLPSSSMQPPSSKPPATQPTTGATMTPRGFKPSMPTTTGRATPPPQAGFKHLATVPATQLVAVPVHAKYKNTVQQVPPPPPPPTPVGQPAGRAAAAGGGVPVTSPLPQHIATTPRPAAAPKPPSAGGAAVRGPPPPPAPGPSSPVTMGTARPSPPTSGSVSAAGAAKVHAPSATTPSMPRSGAPGGPAAAAAAPPAANRSAHVRPSPAPAPTI